MAEKTKTIYICDACKKESEDRFHIIAYQIAGASLAIMVDGKKYEDFCSPCYSKVCDLMNELHDNITEETKED